MGSISTEYLGKLEDQSVGFLVPFGVTSISVIGIGQGGPGGSAQGAGARGGGGAGGTFVRIDTLAVTPGEVLDAFIPGDTSVANTKGKSTTLKRGATVLLEAEGGAPGGNGVTGSLLGSAGLGSIASSIGDTLYRGGHGAAATSSRTGAGGGGAGTGGPGKDATTTTNAGSTPDLGGPGGVSITGTTGNSTGAFGGQYGGGGSGAKADSGTLRTNLGGKMGALIIYFDYADDPPTPSDAAYCDDFTGGDNPDIEGRELDGCGGSPGGHYNYDDAYNSPGLSLAIVGGKLVSPTAQEVQYLNDDATCPGVVTTPRGGRINARWPNYDAVSTPESCTLIWEDTFSGASGALEGRVHNGGSAGNGTYRRIDSHATSSPSGAQVDGSGGVVMLDNLLAGYDIVLDTPLGNTNYDVVIEVERVGSAGPYGNFGATVRSINHYPPVSGQHGRFNYGLLMTTEPPGSLTDPDNYAHWTGWVANGPFGNVITGSATVDPPGDHGIDPDETRSIRYKVRASNGIVWAYMGDDINMSPCDSGWRIAAGVQDGEFGGAPLGTYSGHPGVRWNALATLPNAHVNSYRLKAIRIYHYTPAVSGVVYTYGYPYINLNTDESTGKGYQVMFEGYYAPEGFTLSTAIWEFGGIDDPDDGSFFKSLAVSRYILGTIPAVMDTDYILEAGMEEEPGTHHQTIVARINGIIVRRFDLNSDIPSGSVAPLNPERIHTGGSVGIGMYDGNFAFDGNYAVTVSRWEVLCAGEEEIPCEGPPDNPYPWEPPPVTKPISSIIGWKNGQFRNFPEAWQWKNGVFRKVIGPEIVTPQQFWGRGQMRDLGYFFSDQQPPPDTPLPPFYDPCNLLPEIPPPVAVDPIAGRFLGMANAPMSVNGPLFNGAKIALGSWTASDLALCSAKGVILVTGQGGYKQYLLGGTRFNRDFFIDESMNHIGPRLSMLQDYTISGEYFGHSCIDDFDSPSLWPPYGVSDGDMAYIVTNLKLLCPGIRIGCRGKPSQFPTNVGFNFYQAQYVSWRHISASAFGALEYSRARSWGAYAVLDLNYVHGGNGSSGIRYANNTGLGESSHNFMCSPTETQDYLIDMFAAALAVDGTAQFLAGSVGYQYNTQYLSQPGCTNALAAARNYLAGLPPL